MNSDEAHGGSSARDGVDTVALPVVARVADPSRRESGVLDPVALARIKALQMRARLVVEGVFSGLHASRHHGASVEFAEHKEYTHGDELRHVDWRLLAKSDKLYVKRFEHETNLRATLVLDASRSMAYGDRFVSKWEYARTLVASLSYLLLEQRDAVGLATFRSRLDGFVPARGDRGHLGVLLRILEQAEPDGGGGAEGTVAATLDVLAERLPRRGMVIVVSDGLEDAERLKASLRRLRHRKHDVAFLQVLDADEVEFPFDELTLFRSMEDERELLVEPRVARASYLEAIQAHCEGIERECRGHGVDYARFTTDEALDRALGRYLATRTNLSRIGS